MVRGPREEPRMARKPLPIAALSATVR